MTTAAIGGFEDPATVRGESADHAAPTAGPARPGGLTLSVLVLAALVASPAIWQCLVSHTVPVQVMLERYVLIAVGCLVVSEGVSRLLGPSVRTTTAHGMPADAGPVADETLVMPAVAPGAGSGVVPTVDGPATVADPALTAVAALD